MQGRRHEIESAGGRLVFVGNGSPRLAQRFRERTVPGATVLTDPSLASYRALGLRRGVGETLGPRSLFAGARSVLRGNLQGRVQGDAWQQGGLFVVAPGGELLFAQRNRDASERPRIDEALASLRAKPDVAPRP